MAYTEWRLKDASLLHF